MFLQLKDCDAAPDMNRSSRPEVPEEGDVEERVKAIVLLLDDHVYS